ncbi:MAG: asparagine synthase (glutamine-hydrolyzing) [bacterium]
MCGICGFINYDLHREEASQVIHRMCQAMHHRGPDDMGTYLDQDAVIGMRRLSIIDLETGHQPISNEERTLWVVANGEIYNFRELREGLQERGHIFRSGSDSEVLVHLYEEKGVECLHQLVGMFAFAIWDTRNRSLFLARDRLGIKPLHFARIRDAVVFGSEIKAILEYPGFVRTIDPQAVNLYLTYEYIPAPQTIFQSIQKLPPGHFLTVNQGGSIRIHQYWDLDYRSKIRLASTHEYREALLDKLAVAVRRRLVSDVPLGTFLSGGIDSGMIAALMRNFASDRVDSFNIGFREKSFDESGYARIVADHLRINHRSQTFDTGTLLTVLPQVADNLDEPLGDASILPTCLLCKFCRKFVTVALSGDGGDELFAGYYTYQAHRLVKLYTLIPRLIRQGVLERFINRLPVSTDNFSFDFRAKRFIAGIGYPDEIRHQVWMGSFTPDEKKSLLHPDFRAAIQGHDEFSLIRSYLSSAPVEDWLDALLYLDMKLYLQEDLLVKADRASMANALEVRVPFLDHEFVGFVTRLPSRLKLHGLTTKYLLKQSAQGLLPPSIIHRPKKGFGIPVAKWIKAELKSLFAEVFAPDKIQAQGIFNPDCIQQLLQEHWSGRFDHRKKLWTLFMFQMWYSRYAGQRSS